MKTRKPAAKFEVVGSITVDAGIVQVGDPCYMFDIGKTRCWSQYVKETGILEMDQTLELPHDDAVGGYAEAGSAVVVSSGMGDGIYDVEVKRCPTTGLVKEMRIRFF